MSQDTYSLADLDDALDAIGIRRGAGTLVLHSSLFEIGRLEGVPLREQPPVVIQALLDRIAPDGTLAMPAANWDYGKTGVFDLRHTPPSKLLGVVPASFLGFPGICRSLNPIFSVAALGPQAEFICDGGTATAFGADSAWDRLFQLDAEMLFLGCGLMFMTLARYIEHRFGVPYVYNKLFSAPVTDDGRPFDPPVVTTLRFLHCSRDYALGRFEQRLRERGILREAPLGGGVARALRMSDAYREGVAALKEDIHYFLDEPPAYAPSQPPIA
ncbi:MAG: AAC(3) family N-acetyltransferase [Magnetospirillum sp. WYHS-4]